MEYFVDALRQYANFSGRATRQQYWMYVLIYVAISLVLGVIDSLIGLALLGLIFSLVLLVPGISIATRRLHDIGRSGWWQLLWIIPVIGWIVLLVFFVTDSADDNTYGANSNSTPATEPGN